MSLLLLLGTPSAGVAPVVNYFARFNGTTDYAALPAFSMPSSSGTLLVRARLDAATPAVNKTGFVEINTSGDYGHYTYINGLVYCSIFRVTRVDAITPSVSIDRADWHWVVVRTNAGSGWEMLQANDAGTLYSIATASHEAFNQSVTGFIAKTTASEKLDGDIDRMLLFNSRLNDGDIQAIIAGGNGASPVFRYEFSSNAGGVFADSSGNGRHATISGSPAIIAE